MNDQINLTTDLTTLGDKMVSSLLDSNLLMKGNGTTHKHQTVLRDNSVTRRSKKTERVAVDFSGCGIKAYIGSPPPTKFLMEGLFPMASVCILAAAGGVGKGMLTLDLALNIASTTSSSYGSSFGPRITEHGSAVLFCAEDSKDEIHRRYAVLDPENTREHINSNFNKNQIYSIPLPNEGGAFPIIENDKHLGFTESQEFSEIKNWLKTIPDLKLIVFDPVASFVWGADTNDASAMTFLMNTLQGIATETGACCIVTHHTNKPARNSQGKFQEHETIEDIFHSMRGSTAIGNGARLVYVIAEASKSVQDKVFKALERKRERHTVYIGGVAKSNGITNKEEQIFLRDEEKGLLINVTTKVKDKTLSKKDLKEVLLKTISDYEEKNPFTLTGPWGLFHRRYELPSVLQDRPRKELEDLANQLLQEERIGKYAKKRSAKASYLGITGGLLSRGKETDNLYDPSLKAAFIQAIYEAEQEGQPFNKGGVSSPWNKREKLPPEFSDLSEKQLRKMTEDILTEKSVVKAMHGFEKNAQWLCAPNGSLAMNPEDYEFKKGSIRQNVGSILGEKR